MIHYSWRKSVDNMMNECSTWATKCEFMLNDLALNRVDKKTADNEDTLFIMEEKCGQHDE